MRLNRASSVLKLTLDELAQVRTILEKIELGEIEPRIPGRIGRFLRQYSAGRAQLDRALAKRDLERRADGPLSGVSLGRVEVHPFLEPQVSALDYPLGEVAQTLAVSEELGGVLDVVMWLKGPVANSVYNFFRSNTAVAFSGDYRWTPPSRFTPGEALLEPSRSSVTWERSRCLKAVSDDLLRPPHALEYLTDFRVGPPGLKYFRCLCVARIEGGWRVLPALEEPKPLDVADVMPGAVSAFDSAPLLKVLVFREPWSEAWTVVKAVAVDARQVLVHSLEWADFQRELEGSESDAILVRAIREALHTAGIRPKASEGASLSRSLTSTARDVLRCLRGSC